MAWYGGLLTENYSTQTLASPGRLQAGTAKHGRQRSWNCAGRQILIRIGGGSPLEFSRFQEA